MRLSLLLAAIVLPSVAADITVPYPGPLPGAPEVLRAEDGTPIGLKNDTMVWEADPFFTLTTETDAYSSREDFVSSVPQTAEALLTEEPRATAAVPGKAITATFRSEKAGITITWRAELRENSHYVRETYTLTADRALSLTGFTPIELEDKGFSIPGEVPGTPLVQEAERAFYGVELPMAQAEVKDGRARMGVDCHLPLAAGQSVSFTTVAGVFPEGQLRRAFLAYLERERAVPYHPVLLYNSRWDYGSNPTERKLLNTMEDFDTELFKKRGVRPDSFVLDEGWDDETSNLPQPHLQKFPKGFAPVTEKLRGMGSQLGLRISPLGGCSGAEEKLAEPAYRARFTDRCRKLVEKDGVNFFLWDMAGGSLSLQGMAMTDIARELRQDHPDLFLCLAEGAWPSPFWLHFADSTWRTGSENVAWMGEGSNRDRAITYRDTACYRLIVKRAPLYPLNSLMHHGLVLGRELQARFTSDMRRAEQVPTLPAAEDIHATCPIDFPVNNDLRADARILMASGANLQELYLTPEMMDSRAWDDVAEAVKWSRRRAAVLADAHWVGGDPAQGEVYGYAAWRENQGATLALRNPCASPRTIELHLSDFEPVSPRPVHLRAAYADQRLQELPLNAANPLSVELKPFEVLVFEADFPEKAEKMTTK